MPCVEDQAMGMDRKTILVVDNLIDIRNLIRIAAGGAHAQINDPLAPLGIVCAWEKPCLGQAPFRYSEVASNVSRRRHPRYARP